MSEEEQEEEETLRQKLEKTLAHFQAVLNDPNPFVENEYRNKEPDVFTWRVGVIREQARDRIAFLKAALKV